MRRKYVTREENRVELSRAEQGTEEEEEENSVKLRFNYSSDHLKRGISFYEHTHNHVATAMATGAGAIVHQRTEEGKKKNVTFHFFPLFVRPLFSLSLLPSFYCYCS